MSAALKIIKKGFNFYTDYIDRYMHNTMENVGFHLVRDKEKADIAIVCINDLNSRYMYFVSDYFLNADKNTKNIISTAAEKNFKSYAQFSEIDTDRFSFGITDGKPIIHINNKEDTDLHIMMFSKKYNAFEEPAFVRGGNSELVNVSRDAEFRTNKINMFTYQNYGGIKKGLTIYADADTDNIVFGKAEICKNGVAEELCFERISENGVYRYKCCLPDFEIPEGINKNSARLLYKKGQDERIKRQFFIKICVEDKEDKICDFRLTLIPWQKDI